MTIFCNAMHSMCPTMCIVEYTVRLRLQQQSLKRANFTTKALIYVLLIHNIQVVLKQNKSPSKPASFRAACFIRGGYTKYTVVCAVCNVTMCTLVVGGLRKYQCELYIINYET